MEDEATISKFKATCLALLRITGDIMSPPVAESEWEASLGDTTSRPCR